MLLYPEANFYQSNRVDVYLSVYQVEILYWSIYLETRYTQAKKYNSCKYLSLARKLMYYDLVDPQRLTNARVCWHHIYQCSTVCKYLCCTGILHGIADACRDNLI